MIIKAVDLGKGTRIELDGDVYIVIEVHHQAMQQRRPVTRAKVRNVKTGRVLEKSFVSYDKIEVADLEYRPMQYLYTSGEDFVFMDNNNYEQIHLNAEMLGDNQYYLKEGLEVSVAVHRGIPIGVELPPKVVLKVIETVPGVKGDTVTNVTKKAKLETGVEVQVPLFITEGEKIRVDTRTGTYIERA